MKHSIPVRFVGAVEVDVPDRLSPQDAQLLAQKLALARIVATTDNPDGPKEAACVEYINQSNSGVEEDWDAAVVLGVDGIWTMENLVDDNQDRLVALVGQLGFG